MNKKYQITALVMVTLLLLVAGCGPAPAGLTETIVSPTALPEPTASEPAATASPSPRASTVTPVLTATQPPTTTLRPSPTEPAIETYIAYVQNDSLLVTHVLAGKLLDTRKIITSEMRGGILSLVWSPSGEYLAFSMVTDAFSHVFVANFLDGSEPIDLGIAEEPAWSPDSKLLAFDHEYELWVYSPGNGQSRRLTTHLGFDWLWGTPAFTPAGDALIAAGTASDNVDRHGNTRYGLYRVPLDGSAAGSYPPNANTPSISPEINGRMPLALRFSPDGQKLAIVASAYIDNCAPWAAYQIAKADGSELHDLPVPSLAALVGPELNPYFYGDSLTWTPRSDSLWVNGLVRDCTIAAKIVGEPRIIHINLAGQEHESIQGAFDHISLDRTGSLLGVVNRNGDPRVQLLGLDGHLVLDLGEGDLALLQP